MTINITPEQVESFENHGFSKEKVGATIEHYRQQGLSDNEIQTKLNQKVTLWQENPTPSSNKHFDLTPSGLVNNTSITLWLVFLFILFYVVKKFEILQKILVLLAVLIYSFLLFCFIYSIMFSDSKPLIKLTVFWISIILSFYIFVFIIEKLAKILPNWLLNYITTIKASLSKLKIRYKQDWYKYTSIQLLLIIALTLLFN